MSCTACTGWCCVPLQLLDRFVCLASVGGWRMCVIEEDYNIQLHSNYEREEQIFGTTSIATRRNLAKSPLIIRRFHQL